MIAYILQLHRDKKMVWQGLLFGIFFFAIYSLLDTLNGGYTEMAEQFGAWLVIINILTNFAMAVLSAIMMNLSTNLFHYTGKEGNGSWVPSLSVLFGILTYGCTPCVIAFFASIGIAFSVAALPFAGYPYKIISLLLTIAGLFYIYYEVSHAKCKPTRPVSKSE